MPFLSPNQQRQSTEVKFDKFVVKWILKIPPHLAHVATLPCETLMSAKESINDKLQGSVGTYLRYDDVVNKGCKGNCGPDRK